MNWRATFQPGRATFEQFHATLEQFRNLGTGTQPLNRYATFDRLCRCVLGRGALRPGGVHGGASCPMCFSGVTFLDPTWVRWVRWARSGQVDLT